MPDILICDRDRSFAESLETYLVGCGFSVEVSDVGSRGAHKLLSTSCGVVILGVYQDDEESLEMIPLIHQINRDLPTVAVGDGDSLAMERQVRLQKVFYYMVRPLDYEELRQVVCRALKGRALGGKRHD